MPASVHAFAVAPLTTDFPTKQVSTAFSAVSKRGALYSGTAAHLIGWAVCFVVLLAQNASAEAIGTIRCFNDQELFFPIKCDEKGKNCSPSTQIVQHSVDELILDKENGGVLIEGMCAGRKWFGNADPNPTLALEGPDSLPDGLVVNGRSITWAPNQVPDVDTQLRFVARGFNSRDRENYEQRFVVTVKPYYKGKANARNDWQRLCDQGLRSWSVIDPEIAKGATASESPDPAPTLPSDYLAFQAHFQHLSTTDFESLDLTVAQIITAEILYSQYRDLILRPLEIAETSELKNAVKAFVLLLPDEVTVPFANRVRGFSDKNSESFQHFVRYEFKANFGLFGGLLYRWNICTHAVNCKGLGGRSVTYEEYLESIQFIRDKQLGIEQKDLYFLYLMAQPQLSALHFYHRDWYYLGPWIPRLIADQAVKADELFRQKTTPSFACNNAAKDYLREPIPWERLGMQWYTPSGSWLPWIHPWIVQSIGRSMHEDPIIWDLAKMVPLLGSALSLVDAALTLYEGKDLYGQPIDRRLGAFNLAMEVTVASLDVLGAAQSVEYLRLVEQVKKWKVSAKTTSQARAFLSEVAVLLRRQLKMVPKGFEGVRPCPTRPGALSSSGSISGMSVKGGGWLTTSCYIRSLYDSAQQVIATLRHEVRKTLDSNKLISLSRLEEAEDAAKTRLGFSKSPDIPPVGNKEEKFKFCYYWREVRKELLKSGEGDPVQVLLGAQAFKERYPASNNGLYLTPTVEKEVKNGRRLMGYDMLGLQPTSPVFEAKKTNGITTYIVDLFLAVLQKSGLGVSTEGKNGWKDQCIVAEGVLGPRTIANDSLPHFVTQDLHILDSLSQLNQGKEPPSLGQPKRHDAKRVFDEIIKPIAENGEPIKIELTEAKVRQALGSALDAINPQDTFGVPIVNGKPSFDFSNLTFLVDAQPYLCEHFKDEAIRKAYPYTAEVASCFKQN